MRIRTLMIAALGSTALYAAGCAEHDAAGRGAAAAGPEAAKLVAWTKSVPTVGTIETLATFDGPMPTGVTVSQDGRIFVNFPRWGDAVEFTVAELKNGKAVAYPDAAFNKYDAQAVAQHLVSVQSVVVDPANRLWLLDTGSLNLGPTVPGGPKLVGVDLATNKIYKTILFPPEVALRTSYLNDVRFDLRRGKDGTAYITDSGADGPNGIVVVDLHSGRSWRKLTGHASVKPEANFVPTVEGRPLMVRPVPGTAQPMTLGSDGIAISADGKRLFYTPLASRHVYSVSTDALGDPSSGDEQAAASVQDLGQRDYASDGLESDAAGNLYLTDYEHNAVHRRSADGKDTIIAQDPKMVWPDTMSLAGDGYLYFTANQLDRQKNYNEGKDLREKPYLLLRTRVDAKPVLLK